ncbi:MAG: efflux RND transporter permease subunit, partial [Sporichthyaceae bacterium]|nr:efflux RND transporter permease subunit [Sporichthyaceae bacterium]
LGVRHVLPITTSDDLAKVIVDRPGSDDLRLGDVAEVVENHQPLIGDALVDGGPGLLMVIERFPGANTREVTRQVEAALESMRPGLAGITVDTTVYRSASYLETSLDRLSLALLIGGLLVLVLLALLLFDWRSVVLGAAAIALSVTAAALVLHLRGATFNVVVLAGLTMAVTVIVGDAIRDVASIHDRLREHRASGASGSTATVIAQACLQLRRPLGWATLVIVAATAPLLLAGGVVGSFLRPLAVSYLLATVASMVVALTVTPALAMVLQSGRGRVSGPDPSPARRAPLAGVITRLQRSYSEALAATLRRSGAIVAGAAVVGLVVLAALPLLGSRQLLPAAQDRDLVIGWDAAPGTSQPEMVRITERAIAELRQTPGVRAVGAHVGRAVSSDQVVDTDSGAIWLTIDPAANYPATVDAIKQVVAGYPGMDSEVHTYPEAVLSRQHDDIGAGVVVRI